MSLDDKCGFQGCGHKEQGYRSLLPGALEGLSAQEVPEGLVHPEEETEQGVQCEHFIIPRVGSSAGMKP